MTVRILVFTTVEPADTAAFEAAFAEVAARMRGTPGLLSDELLADGAEPGRYVLISEWASEAAFRAWEDAGTHRDTTVPMRRFWTGRAERRIYRTAVLTSPQTGAAR